MLAGLRSPWPPSPSGVGRLRHLARLIARWLVGPLHRPLLPAAALVGAIVVIVADAIARAALPPAEIPPGLVTAVAGGPFFILLLARRLRT